MLISTIL